MHSSIMFGMVLLFACVLLGSSVFVAGFVGPEYRELLATYLSVTGTIVTATGFCFGAYYAVLAVSAYSHHRHIESMAEDVDKEAKHVSVLRGQCQNAVESVTAYCGQVHRNIDAVLASLLASFTYLDMMPLDNKERFYRELSIQRARLSLGNPTLSDEEKIRSILTLRNFRDAASKTLLEQLAADPTQTQGVRRAAGEVENERA